VRRRLQRRHFRRVRHGMMPRAEQSAVPHGESRYQSQRSQLQNRCAPLCFQGQRVRLVWSRWYPVDSEF
jgi:hypothetical protein